MAQISGPEVKHALRKLEYPNCAREALIKIGQLISGRTPTLKQMDLALDLMAELVFCEVDRRGIKRQKRLSPLSELQLLEVLFEYFNQNNNEAARNAVFLSLFSGTTATIRSSILCKLISIAVAVPSQSILLASSVWMQQLGNTSSNSNTLAKAIIDDYFMFSSSFLPKLNVLPVVAPQFTANFLTAVANMYFASYDEILTVPPDGLLKTLTQWIKENSKLCIAAQEYPCVLPPGAIAMEATTPIAGLTRWCILAPIAKQHSELYGQLHLGLLSSIAEIPVSSSPRAIPVQSLSHIVSVILKYVQNRNGTIDGDFQVALDRFAQIIQVALSVNCMYGNMEEFLKSLEELPKIRLLDIVIQTYYFDKTRL